jgi:isoleucyl-tRNA synthetase
MRKEMDLDIEEPIRLEYAVADDRVADLVARHEALVAEEVRADAIGTVEDGHRKTWDVEGIEVEIAIEPVATAEVSD